MSTAQPIRAELAGGANWPSRSRAVAAGVD